MMRGSRIRSPHRQSVAKAMVFSSLLAASVVGMGPSSAYAQFSLFGQSDASPQDIYGTIASHGFRMVGPLFRNGRVYVADVLDRRQRRERLIIAADSGQIVQRFFVDVSGPERRPALADDGRRRLPRDSDQDSSFFSSLTRGWGDETPPRPPVGLDDGGDDGVMPRPLPAPRVTRPRPEPRVVTRTEDAPIGTAPLPAPAPGPAKSAEKSAQPSAAPASVPAPPSSGRPTTVVVDPLRIPGQRTADTPKPAPAPANVATTKPADSKSAPAGDVPVAPLD